MSAQIDNLKPESPAGFTPSGGSGHRVEQRWWPTTLECCPPGLFLFEGRFGFKTEYSDQNGPEAYCVESGEYFWGGTNGDAQARRLLMVTPMIVQNDGTQRPGDAEATKATRATPPGSLK